MITLLLSVIVIAAVTFLAEKRLTRAVRNEQEALEALRVAMHKQSKVFTRQMEQTRRAANKAVDQSRCAVDDARQLHEIAQAMVREVRGNGG